MFCDRGLFRQLGEGVQHTHTKLGEGVEHVYTIVQNVATHKDTVYSLDQV